MDRKWMSKSRLNNEYEQGVKDFIAVASAYAAKNGLKRVHCPCIGCFKHGRKILVAGNGLMDHLIGKGIDPQYKVWIHHGEGETEVQNITTQPQGVTMDRKWMSANRLSDEYKQGVKEFIAVASAYAVKNGTERVWCPCMRCLNFQKVIVACTALMDHLITYGIIPGYKVWYLHGERLPPKVVESKVDRKWMVACRLNNEYEQGVKDFIAVASAYAAKNGITEVHCPCNRCFKNGKKILVAGPGAGLMDHLITYGIVRGYKVWYLHGEDFPRQVVGSGSKVDRKWMVACRLSDEYEQGVKDFVAVATAYAVKNELTKVHCPCKRCFKHGRKILVVGAGLMDHLICKGIDPQYKVWYLHGETEVQNITPQPQGVTMDRKWMYANRLSDEYRQGVKEFIAVASAYAVKNGTEKVWCPCSRCLNVEMVFVAGAALMDHLITNGFFFLYQVWYLHGEDFPPKVVEHVSKMDRKWMSACRSSDEYEQGVKDFIAVASAYAAKNGMKKVLCPCIRCFKHGRTILVAGAGLMDHLICKGIDPRYKVWYHHGETEVQNITPQPQGETLLKGVTMDRKWMSANRLSEEYKQGVKEFITVSLIYAVKNGTQKVWCPCIRCVNMEMVFVASAAMADHLLTYGINPQYKVWHLHGEDFTPQVVESLPENSNGREDGYSSSGSN